MIGHKFVRSVSRSELIFNTSLVSGIFVGSFDPLIFPPSLAGGIEHGVYLELVLGHGS
jgi:hypothetical protein